METSRTGTNPVIKRGNNLQFWLIFLAMCGILFLSALEFTATANALPIIIDELHGEGFAWVGTSYALASTALLPLSGCIAQIFGRKLAFIAAILVFALGSALCGAAQTMHWLIAARSPIARARIIQQSYRHVRPCIFPQGVDPVEIFRTWAIAVAIGPLVGGALAQSKRWRWLFYFNIPVCGVALIHAILFMDLPTPPPGTWREKLAALDWIGNGLVIASTTSLVTAFTWGGVRFPWGSASVLVPLSLGMIGLVVWSIYEIKLASHPMVPRELARHRTSVSGYAQVFINSLVAVSWIYYIPVYFQACKDASPVHSSIDMFGLSIGVSPFVVCGGVSVAILKFYRPQLWIGWILMMAGAGALSAMDATTPISHPTGIIIIGAAGSGMLFATTYVPVLSPLPISENAHALALFAFFRSLAQIWGITIGSAILTNQLRTQLPSHFLSTFPGGVDLVYSIIPQIQALEQPLKAQVQAAFANSLRPVWYTCVGFSFLGFLISLLMADVPMHNSVDKNWALTNDKEVEKAEEVPV